ncbi:hypothetical protein NJJ93_002593 [Salmonella enterica]|nr:hypothetical protein [Salmonella enterica]
MLKNQASSMITGIETYYDGVDLNADYGTPTERQHDYTLAQYGWNNLPTNHIVSNIQAYKTHGVGIWGGRIYRVLSRYLCIIFSGSRYIYQRKWEDF